MRIARLALLGVSALVAACGSESFEVGGFVTGLKGRGLTLHNNGGDPLVINGDGPFKFAGKLKEGEGYAVTIAALPTRPSQSCGVQNGVGASITGPVSDVIVTCSTNTFAVGGVVSGLVEGTVTLQLNGGDTIVASNGPFSFQRRLEDMSNYSVVVMGSPPEHDCNAFSGSGQLNGADVMSVQVNCVQKTYVLGGEVEGLTGGTLVLRLDGHGEGLSITRNGRFVFDTRLPLGATFETYIADRDQPQGQRCLLSNGSGTIAGHTENLLIKCYPYLILENSPTATTVIGQRDFTGSNRNHGDPPSASGLDGPSGHPLLVGGNLYIADTRSHRLLAFAGVPQENLASASFVLGQPDFETVTQGAAEEGGLSNPRAVSSDGTRFAVADTGHHRVLLHAAVPRNSSTEPDIVVGQADRSSTQPGCDASSLSSPSDVFLGAGKLIVADTGNHRILVWNSIPEADGEPAALVLGQRNLTTCAANDANGDGASDASPAATTLNAPTGVWTDGTRLVVADRDNHRVLIWNQFPTSNGKAADIVIGQAGFTTRTVATTATGLNTPSSVLGTPLQLFVADSENNRVLVWNQFPTANGQAADVVVGQLDFTSGGTAKPPHAESFDYPNGLFLSWPYLGVTDNGNNRVLFFRGL